MIEVKVSIQHGERLKSYNAWNKEMPILVKGIGGNKDSFQLPPMIRVVIPTDTTLELQDLVAIAYSHPEATFKHALVLAGGPQPINTSGKVELVLQNMSESLVTISAGDVIAYIMKPM